MKMNTALPFSIILPVIFLFSIDPDTTLVADNTQKLYYRDIVVTDDNKAKSDKKYDMTNISVLTVNHTV
jgi:hypothetical protein